MHAALQAEARDDTPGLLERMRALTPGNRLMDPGLFARLLASLNGRALGPADAAAIYHVLRRAGSLEEAEDGTLSGEWRRPVRPGGGMDAALMWRLARAAPRRMV